MAEFEFPRFYSKQKDKVDAALEHWLPAIDKPPEPLGEAMNYSVFNGGKRLRGVLVLEAARLGFARRSRAVASLAAAVELIHAYSLVHDDLPAMDDDDYRRGKPSCHRQFGDDMAILCGDSLLTLAFEILGQLDNDGLSADAQSEILTEAAELAGWRGLIGGQVRDLKAVDGAMDIDDLKVLHAEKTGALITYCLKAGALVGGAGQSLINMLEEFGKKIGLAFQIKDDLLDINGDFEKIGKDVNSDSEAEKVTYPRLIGVDKSRQLLEDIIDEVEELLKDGTEDGARLIDLARLVAERDR